MIHRLVDRRIREKTDMIHRLVDSRKKRKNRHRTNFSDDENKCKNGHDKHTGGKRKIEKKTGIIHSLV